MQLRDFLIWIKINTNLNIKIQYQIYLQLKNTEIKSFKDTIFKLSSLSSTQQNNLSKQFETDEAKDRILNNKKTGGILCITDQQYPKLLKEIFCPPTVLFYRGNLTLFEEKLIGMVGSRDVSSYGIKIIQQLVPISIKHNLTIVSGLAKGVDSLSHQVAIHSSGKTIGVIGTGLDRVYPKSNQILQTQIAKQYLLITEYPAGAPPLKHHFVERNRIIAGLSKATCVIEAKEHSGSLITANFALDENRNVLAVPGSIYSNNSVGTNQLIAAGARPLLSIQDVLEECLI